MKTSLNPAEIPFQQVITALLDVDNPLSPSYLYRFSDLEKPDLALLADAWPKIPHWRRKALMEDIEQLGEDNTLLNFEAISRFTAQDSDPEVRLLAIQTLWEYEDPGLIQIYLDFLNNDQSPEVRAAAATGLGKFIYLGEIEEIRESLLHKIEDRLLALLDSQDDEPVRRSALESLGYSSRDEIPAHIEAAFQSGDRHWMASALFAMGRSYNVRWKPSVLTMLDNPLPVLRAEAARAAGELELVVAVPRLVELLDDPDEETRLASIWSLSQLGGDGVRKHLERLFAETDDDEERAFIDTALDNLTFNEEMDLLPLMDLTETPRTPTDLPEDEFEQYFAEAFAEDFDDEFDDEYDLDDDEDAEEWYDEEDEEDEDLDG